MKERLSSILKRIKKCSFYKKKKFYVVLTVLFSLILLADVAIAAFVPSQSGRGGTRNDFSQMSGFPENSGDTENGEMTMPEGMELPEDMEMPGKMDSENGERTMPEGMELPEGMEMPEGMELPEGADTENGEMTMPGGRGMSEMADMTQSNAGFLQTVKAHWLVIFIIFFILDGASIFMLVYLTKKEKKQKEQEIKEQAALNNEVHVVRKPVKKERHTQYRGLIILGAMLLIVIVIKVLTAQTGEEVSQTEATVYSGTTEKGSVSSILPGTGTLAEEDAVALELPANVEITQWYVSNGDTVAEGDKIAQVDTVSVMSAIVEVQEKMEALDEALEEHEDEEISDTITAGAAGRIKKIYAQEDAGVIETMYENGSLMLISLDGLMAVSIETEAEISAGDAVTVTLSDGSEESGKVESMIAGTAVITISDENADYEETVTVTAEDGTDVGTGELYIHRELKVTGFTGTISAVKVSLEDEVSSEKTLMTLTDTDYTGEYELLLSKRSELEAQMQKLFQLYQEQYVYADCAGVISGLTVTQTTEEADTQENASSETDAEGNETETSESENTATTTSYSNKNVGMKSMSYTSSGNKGGVRMLTAAGDADVQTAAEITTETTPEITPEVTPEGGTETAPEDGQETKPEENEGSGSNEGGTTSPESGNGTTPDSGTGTEQDGGNGAGTGSSYTNCIGTVTAVEYSGSSVVITLASANGPGVSTLTLPASLQAYSFANGKYTAGTAADIQVNDIIMVVYASGTSPDFCIRITGTTSGTPTEGDSSSGMQDMSGMGSAGQSSGSVQFPPGSSSSADMANQTANTEVMAVLEEEVEMDYGVEVTNWLSITPQEKMEITITVDEMDILSLEKGLDAQVTLDAFPGQSFEGVVTGVSVSGTNSGGSSKYQAVVSIDRQENMLAGMNASVQITLDTKEDVLIIPEAALVEEKSGVYGYTSNYEKTDTFGDLVEVTTGVSDGENVEILSGLEEGSEYWYSCLDVVNYTGTFSSNRGGFSLNSMFGGGRGR